MSTNFDDLRDELDGRHITDVALIAAALVKFHKVREETYQLSFARRGEIGVWINLARKYDRMDELCRQYFQMGAVTPNLARTMVDTLVDISIYSLKWLAVILATKEDAFKVWVDDIFAKELEITQKEALNFFGLSGEIEDTDIGPSIMERMMDWVQEAVEEIALEDIQKFAKYNMPDPSWNAIAHVIDKTSVPFVPEKKRYDPPTFLKIDPANTPSLWATFVQEASRDWSLHDVEIPLDYHVIREPGLPYDTMVSDDEEEEFREELRNAREFFESMEREYDPEDTLQGDFTKSETEMLERHDEVLREMITGVEPDGPYDESAEDYHQLPSFLKKKS